MTQTTQTRDEIIAGLQSCNTMESARLADRLQQCTVRICRTDGSYDQDSDIRTARQAASAMMDDPTIESIQYHFNGEWIVATSIPTRPILGRPLEMTDGKRVNVYLDSVSLARAAELGLGNVSEGIRIALAIK